MPLFKGVLNPVQLATNYKRFGVTGLTNAGGAAVVSGKFSGGVAMNAGNGATSYAKVAWNSAFSTITQSTGGGINFGLGVGIYAWGLFSLDTTLAAGQAIRIILGDDAATTAPTNSTQNAISTRGFGLEVYNDSGTKKIRLFAHDGTTYSTSAGVSGYQFFYTYSMQFYVKNDSSGKVYLYYAESSAENGLVPSLPSSPIITLTGGPTSVTSAKRYVTANIVMNGTNNPANANSTLIHLDETIFTVGV
jgi:hypothetical protein